MKNKLIIAGSRSFEDYLLLKREVDIFIAEEQINDNVEIVSGTARGADLLGENYAHQYKLPLTRFPADWDKFGKSAGYRRNKDMAIYASSSPFPITYNTGYCIVFWNGESKGTKHMIDLAEEYGLKLKIITYDDKIS